MDLCDHWNAWASLAGAGEDRAGAAMVLNECVFDCNISLNLSGFGLIALPDHWPAGLRVLDVSNNRLRHIGPLPDTLRTLQASSNNFNSLHALSRLPDTLDTADVSFSPVCDFQELLPQNIRVLIAESLLDLPPGEETSFWSSMLPLQDMWVPAASGRQEGTAACVSNSRWPNRHFPGMHHRFDAVPSSVGLHALRDPCSVLDRSVAPWYPSRFARGIHALWLPFSSEAGAVPFAQLMGQLAVSMKVALPVNETLDLTGGLHYIRDGAFKTHVQRWLNELATTPMLRAATFAIAEASIASCSDSVLLTYNGMQTQRMLSAIDAGDHDGDLPALVGNLRKLFRLQLLDKLTFNRMHRRNGSGIRLRDVRGAGNVDEVEVYLGYQHALNQRLALNSMVSDMRYYKCSDLTAADIDAAEKHIKRKENAEFLTWMAVSDSWGGVLRRLDPQRYRMMRANYLFVMEDTDSYTSMCAARLQDMHLQPGACDNATAADASAQIGATVAARIKGSIYSAHTRGFFHARSINATELLGAVWPAALTDNQWL